jgi:hypothetical protein
MDYATIVHSSTVKPDRLGYPSAWNGHVPFALWLVQVLKPKVIVELGTHYGGSYFNFCRAVKTGRLGAKCYAVDTWGGDEHAGLYDEDVFADVRSHSEREYPDISCLLRMTFDEALNYFSDGSVDLLHIDGLHTYDAVKHDFETWLPKLAPSAVILFHDTNVRERGFGVWRLWEDLTRRFPLHLEFLHSHGLGVIRIAEGEEADPLDWLRPGSAEQQVVLEHFAARGAEMELLYLGHQLREAVVERDELISALHREVDSLRVAAAEREAMVASTSWRITRPLRFAIGIARREPVYIEQARKLASRARFWSKRSVGDGFEAAGYPATGAPQAAISAGLRIVYLSEGARTPGHSYRVEAYAEAARAAGADSAVIRVENSVERMAEIAAAQVVVVRRTAWSGCTDALIRAARAANARIIFDVDDIAIAPNPAPRRVEEAVAYPPDARWSAAAIDVHLPQPMLEADLCTATTEELASHVRREGQPVFVLPNGYDEATLAASRLAARRRSCTAGDGLLRIGYAGGSDQADFAVCAGALADVLREHANVRLVLFRDALSGQPLTDLRAYTELAELEGLVEWRDLVATPRMPDEFARFDINLAPVETQNPRCEETSESSYWQAALAGVCTVASPAGPFRRAIRDGETGFLAKTPSDWLACLGRLLVDGKLRDRVARAACHEAMWTFGPELRTERMVSVLEYLRGGRHAVRAFMGELQAVRQVPSAPPMPEYETIFESDRLGNADATVVVQMDHCAEFVEGALDSVASQTLAEIDLIVVDNASTDGGASLARAWAGRHVKRFNRLLVLRHPVKSSLGSTRNLGFSIADTLYVLPLDAGYRLLSNGLARCLEAIRASRVAYVYPVIRKFDADDGLMGDAPYDVARLVGGQDTDAMALVSKAAWALVGGYDEIALGREDYNFRCRLAERGLLGAGVGGSPLAEYRVHRGSMPRKMNGVVQTNPGPEASIERRCNWSAGGSHVEQQRAIGYRVSTIAPGDENRSSPSSQSSRATSASGLSLSPGDLGRE